MRLPSSFRRGPLTPSRVQHEWLFMRSKSAFRDLESLPLFATDSVLGAALLGPDRVQEFRQMVPMLEARGMPKIDHLMGGRYTRAVVAWFDQQYGLNRGTAVPLAPDGVEDFEWKRQGQKHPV
jgi:hypothetical protein